MSVAQDFDSIVIAASKAHSWTLIDEPDHLFREIPDQKELNFTQVTINSQGNLANNEGPCLGNSNFKIYDEKCDVYIIAPAEEDRNAIVREFIGNKPYGGSVEGIIHEIQTAYPNTLYYEIGHVKSTDGENNYTALIRIGRRFSG